MKQAVVGYGCVALSLALHAAALRRGGSENALHPQRRFVAVEMALTPPKLPAPLPLPPSPAPSPSPAPRPPPPQKTASLPSEPKPAPAPPAAAEPPLTGTTLVAASDSSWAAAAGNGEARSGALGAGAASKPLAPPAPRSVAPPAPSLQPLARLSRKPVPPPLQQALERYYPALARSQGRSGEAKVRALIEASGRVSHVELSFESEPGFGAACQKALQQSQWTGPLGPGGEPAATFISYRCKFRVGD